MSVEEDRQEVIRIHEAWWKANDTLDIPAMKPLIPEGDNFLMFNLNGQPYIGVDGHVRIWEFLTGKYEYPEPLKVEIMDMDVQGDLAWIACEAQGRIRFLSEEANFETVEDSASESRASRTTEIFKRDDGQGNPEWRLWHFHCSALPAPDEVRMGYDDTRADRKLGQKPDGR